MVAVAIGGYWRGIVSLTPPNREIQIYEIIFVYKFTLACTMKGGENIKVAVRMRGLNEREMRDGKGEGWKCVGGTNISSCDTETGMSYTYGESAQLSECDVPNPDLWPSCRSRICSRGTNRKCVRFCGPRNGSICTARDKRHAFLLRPGSHRSSAPTPAKNCSLCVVHRLV